MKFQQICYHLMHIYLTKLDCFTPPEYEAILAVLDRLLPLLTQDELRAIPCATYHLDCYFYPRKGLTPAATTPETGGTH